MMCESVIYQIKNIQNDKKYIGSTIDKKKRWMKHKWALINNRHDNAYLQRSWNKYGSTSFKFSIVEQVDENSDLISREQYYIDNLKPEYNIALKANGSEHSKETKDKMSEAISGVNNPMYGEEHSEKTKQKMSESQSGKNHPMYGKHLSKETRQKMSESHKDKELSEEHKKNISESMSNPSEETRQKMSESHKGLKPSRGTRQKMGEAKTGEKNPSSELTEKKVKVIKHLLDGDSFTQKEIGEMYGVSRSAIGAINRGRTWTCISIS